MTYLEKEMIDRMDVVDRMGVYEFLEKDGSVQKYCIVVGADHRKHDRFISIVMLTDAEKERGYADAIGIPLPIGDYWCHCGMVTYARRDRLGNKIAKVGNATRKKITKMIGIEMGVINDKRESVWMSEEESDESMKAQLSFWQGQAKHWKELYNELLAAFGKGVKP